MSFRDDPDAYTKVSTRTAAGTLALSRALLVAAGDELSSAEKTRLNRIHGEASELQHIWIAAERPAKPKPKRRPYDLRVDRSWRVARARLLHWAEIEHPERGPRATQLDALLFPDGLKFLRLPYEQQWAEGERRLQLIEDDELEPELAKLVDPAFVDELREAHEAYGQVLGITEQAQPDAEAGRVIDAIRAAQAAIRSYARLVVGLTEEEDDDSVAATEARLAPLLRFRWSPGEPEEVAEAGDVPLPDPPE